MIENQSVQSSPTNLQSEVPQLTTKKKERSTLLFGLLFLFVVFLGTIGYLLYQNNQLRQQIALNKLSEVVPTVTLSPTPNVTSGWKIYKNTRWGYQIDYPEDWLINETYEEEGFVCFLTKKRQEELGQEGPPIRVFDVSVRTYSSISALPNNQESNLSFEDWIEQGTSNYFCGGEAKKVVIANRETYYFSGSNCYSGSGETWMLENGGYVYEMDIETGGKENFELEKKMIESFTLL